MQLVAIAKLRKLKDVLESREYLYLIPVLILTLLYSQECMYDFSTTALSIDNVVEEMSDTAFVFCSYVDIDIGFQATSYPIEQDACEASFKKLMHEQDVFEAFESLKHFEGFECFESLVRKEEYAYADTQVNEEKVKVISSQTIKIAGNKPKFLKWALEEDTCEAAFKKRMLEHEAEIEFV